MSAEHFYHVCTDCVGDAVEIRCHGGEVYHGIVDHVDDEFVYLRPFEDNCCGPESPSGYGTYLWGFGGAFAGGFLGGLFGVALGSIAFVGPRGFW
jgi:hypothetical protein